MNCELPDDSEVSNDAPEAADMAFAVALFAWLALALWGIVSRFL